MQYDEDAERCCLNVMGRTIWSRGVRDRWNNPQAAA